VPRPRHREITFSIDGLEVTAPENTMLVDAAKHGDVEIPVFCYDTKLGQPVGACVLYKSPSPRDLTTSRKTATA
jgi:NADH-quinone oxidoreductase subunit G